MKKFFSNSLLIVAVTFAVSALPWSAQATAPAAKAASAPTPAAPAPTPPRAPAADAGRSTAGSQVPALNRSGFHVTFVQEVYSRLRDKVTKKQGNLSYLPPQKFRWESGAPENREIYVSDGVTLWKYTPATSHAQKLPLQKSGLDFLDIFFGGAPLQTHFAVSPWEPTPSATPAARTKAATGVGRGAKSEGERRVHETYTSEPREDATTANTSRSLSNAETLLPVRSDAPPPLASSHTPLRLVRLTPLQSHPSIEVVFVAINPKHQRPTELRIVYKNGNRMRMVLSDYDEKKPSPETFQFTPPAGTAVDKDFE